MRLLKFIGVALGSVIFIFGIVFALNQRIFYTLFENKDALSEGSEWIEKTYSLAGLAEFIALNPQYVSLVSIPINSTKPDAILWQENEPRSFAGLSSLILLSAYEVLVERGEIDANQPVTKKELDTYLLPGIYENVHRQALAKLEFKNDAVALNEIVRATVEFGNPSFLDYLFFLISPEKIDDLYKNNIFVDLPKPLPFSGLNLLISSEIHSRPFEDVYDELSNLPYSELRLKAIKLSKEYQLDSEFRSRAKGTIQSNRLGLDFRQERDALDFFPKITALRLSSFMKQVVNQNFYSPEVSNSILDKMSWARSNPSQIRHTSLYAAIYDERIGLLAGVDVGYKNDAESGVVQVILFDKLPVGFWIHMSANHMMEEFQRRLTWDDELRETIILSIQRLSNEKI